MRIASVLPLLFGVALTASSQSGVNQDTTNVKPPFTLTISAHLTNVSLENTSDQTRKLSSPIVLRLRKTNTSDHDIPKWTELGFQYEVRDGSGNPVETMKTTQYLSGGEDIIVGEKGLAPGESKIVTKSLTGYKLDRPGTYTIQVSEHIPDDPASDVVKSNRITVTVVEPDPPVADTKSPVCRVLLTPPLQSPSTAPCP
jgi:hypothetical protein